MSTRYVLSKPYRLRGWYKLPMGLYSTVDRKAIFVSKEDYLLLLKCDGAHDLTADTMSEAERATLEELLANEVVRPALPGEFLNQNRLTSHIQHATARACTGRLPAPAT